MGARFKVGADTYDIPDDQVDAFMKDMDASGQKFEGEQAPQRFTVGGQNYDIPAGEVDAFKRDMGIGDAPEAEMTVGTPEVIRRPEPDWSEKMNAAAAGLVDTGTMGLARQIPFGLGERYGQNVDAAMAKALGYATGGQVAGAFANPLNYAIPGGGAALSAASGGLQAGLEAYGHGEPVLPAAAQGAAISWALGAAGPKIVEAGQGLVQRGFGNRARAALGGGAEKFVQREGDDALTALGQEIEERGLHEGGFGPQPQQRYIDNAKGLREQAGPALGDAEDAISQLANEPRVYLQDAANDVRGRGPDQAVAQRDPRGAGRDARFRDELAANMVSDGAGGYAPDLPFSDAVNLRRGYDDQVNYMRRGNVPAKEAAYRDAANSLRDESKAALNAGVDAGDVPAPLRDQWMGANDDFHVSSQVLDNAAPYQPGMVEKAAPYVLGGVGLGAGHPYLGAAAAGVAKYIGPRANSALAGFQGATGRGAQTAGDVVAGVAPQAAALTQALSPAQATQQGNGSQLGEAALDALQNNPQALGPYAQQIAQAASSPEPGAVNALIGRLANDPDFRNGPLQALQQMTMAY